MVAFGKKLRESQIQEWKGYYIDYKLMKKKLNRYTQQVEVGTENHLIVLKDFSRLLDCQIEKFVMFLLEQQGILASRLSNLGEQYDSLFQQADGQKVLELREAYRSVGRDLLKILFFVEMNAIGLRKILKKFDKRFGFKFTNYYVKTRANHPYSELRQACKHVGIGAIVGAISRNLADLQDDRGSYISIYDQPALSHPYYIVHEFMDRHPCSQNISCWKPSKNCGHYNSTVHDYFDRFIQTGDPHENRSALDPVVHSIRAAVDKLSNSTGFLHYLGKHALIMQEEFPSSSEDPPDDNRYHFMSLLLNLANTFLYMVNTYIIVPTADRYTMTLGAAATVCGVVIGSMAVAQVFSSVYFSAWSNRSYMRPLAFSSILLLVGNTLYALAYDLDSISVLLIGRLFCGLGSARAVNRRYISDCVPLKLRMQASAGFVSASALGMACGPALAFLFQTDFKIYKLTFNEVTLPGWAMALAWLVYLLWLWISFREPSRETKENVEPDESNYGRFINGSRETEENPLPEESNSGRFINILVDNKFTQPLLNNKQQDVDGDEDCDDAEEDFKQLQKPVNSIVSAYRLLTPSVKVQLVIYFMLKYAMEIILAESSLITGYYFIWSTSSVAIFLACLGLTVLPVNVIVGSYISNIFEERQVLLASEILVFIGILLSFHVFTSYSVPQYVGSALLTFVSAEVVEGVNLSLLSRVMSSRLSRGTFNGGLLSTEAGTLARVVADGTITLAGYLGVSKVLNITLVPSLFFCVCSIVATCFTYNSLY